jgi:hypothetical protein
MITTSGWAGSLTVTHDFVGGQKALASEVNQNFEDVETEVTNNASDIASNAASISDLKINSNALTLEGRPASDFADSSHTHSEVKSGYVSVSFMTGWDRTSKPATRRAINIWSIDDPSQFANADTSFLWEGRMSLSADTTSSSTVYVPIQLPDGATITEFQLVYYDEKDDGIGIRSSLRRSPSFGPVLTGALIDSTGISYAPQYANTTIEPVFAVVDNSLYSYCIRGDVYGGGTDTVLISAMVQYDLP